MSGLLDNIDYHFKESHRVVAIIHTGAKAAMIHADRKISQRPLYALF
jgi:hypothetical protein